MQYSFYGGQQGKNFEVAKTFHNRVEMIEDLRKRYQSEIAVGDYVFISYGLSKSDANDPSSYEYNANIDKEKYQRKYNATLWQKIYDEGDISEEEQDYVTEAILGLRYKIIAAIAGNTPLIEKGDVIVLNADEDPDVQVDNSDIDYPRLTFKLPQAQRILKKRVSKTTLDADKEPEVILETDGKNDDGTEKINEPTLEFKLPQAQQLLPKNVKFEWVDADGIDINSEDPRYEENGARIIFETTGAYEAEPGQEAIKKINQPSLVFKLPRNERIELANTNPLPPGSMPIVRLHEKGVDEDFDVNVPKLDIRIPKSQTITIADESETLPPLEEPRVEINDDDKENPELTFFLPRAVGFMYGNKLGKWKEKTYTLAFEPDTGDEIEGLRKGDYYVHDTTGFIYLVIEETDNSRTFEFQACLAAPAPSINPVKISAYKQTSTGYTANVFDVTSGWKDTTEQIGQILNFILPRLPDLNGRVEKFVGPDEQGSVRGEPTGANEFTYFFTIPSGARFFCGNEIDDDHTHVAVVDARPGDYYINTLFESKSDGHIYKLISINTNGSYDWEEKGTIKGNVGNPLNITHTTTIIYDEDDPDPSIPSDDLDEVAEYLKTLFDEPEENEIIAVTYRTISSVGTVDIAYWYYLTSEGWGRAQLTGATASLIENGYKDAGDENKAYSVTYINSLLAALDSTLTAAEKKRKGYTVEAIEQMFTWGSFKDL